MSDIFRGAMKIQKVQILPEKAKHLRKVGADSLFTEKTVSSRILRIDKKVMGTFSSFSA